MKTILRSKQVGISATLVLALIVALLTLTPAPAVGPVGADKIYHLIAFAALAFPLSFVRPKASVWIVVGVIAYGAGIELIQPYVGRSAEWGDLFADVAGAMIGGAVGASGNYLISGPTSKKESVRSSVYE